MAAPNGKKRSSVNPPAGGGATGRAPSALQPLQARKPRRNNWSRLLGVASIISAIAVAAFPTFLVAVCGLAPVIAAYLADDQRIPYRLRTIAAANVAAVIPYLTLLWQRGHDVNQATRLLSDPYTWAAMYLGAVSGLALLWLGPVFAAGVFNGMATQRRRSLENYRRRLIEEWGDDILSEKTNPSANSTQNNA